MALSPAGGIFLVEKRRKRGGEGKKKRRKREKKREVRDKKSPDREDDYYPMPPNLKNVKFICCTSDAFAAIVGDEHTVVCWGDPGLKMMKKEKVRKPEKKKKERKTEQREGRGV